MHWKAEVENICQIKYVTKWGKTKIGLEYLQQTEKATPYPFREASFLNSQNLVTENVL